MRGPGQTRTAKHQETAVGSSITAVGHQQTTEQPSIKLQLRQDSHRVIQIPGPGLLAVELEANVRTNELG